MKHAGKWNTFFRPLLEGAAVMITHEHNWETKQFARLARRLPRWGALPVYREQWNGAAAAAFRAHGFRGGFERLPFITKRHLREGFPQNFLGSRERLDALLASGRVELEHTSGSTGERTPVLLERGWWEAQERSALQLNQFVARVLRAAAPARRCVLTTPACDGHVCPSVWRSVDRRTEGATRFVNQARIPFLLPERELDRMAAEVADWAPQFLDVDPVHGAWFGRYCERAGIRFPSLRFILSSYELLSRTHRRVLERTFGMPVFDLYGSTETGHLLMEDEIGRHRPSWEHALLEVPTPDERGIGELVVTTLSNDYMPLLRYRIGDLVEHRRDARGAYYVVHGRGRDCLTTGDGRRVTSEEVDRCFAGVAGVLHYELRQAADGACRLRFVADGDGPSRETLHALTARLRDLLRRPAPLPVEAVPWLPPAPSGKFRLTRREAQPEPQRASAAARTSAAHAAMASRIPAKA